MIIWVDADACPGIIKEIIYKTAERMKIKAIFVANQKLRLPQSEFIDSIVVDAGFDVADNEIVERLSIEDLVITADIPLASAVVDKGAVGINPRGEVYSDANIKTRLGMRNLMDTLRADGIETKGPPPLTNKAKQEFANSLDRTLVQMKKKKRFADILKNKKK
jgi:uncharacterized protein YaiI (UPF0178 family)